MKKFVIEIHGYPQEFTVAAETESEARMEAKKRWHDKMNGVGIYETVVLEEEDLETLE